MPFRVISWIESLPAENDPQSHTKNHKTLVCRFAPQAFPFPRNDITTAILREVSFALTYHPPLQSSELSLDHPARDLT
jgi:hypothetical protein